MGSGYWSTDVYAAAASARGGADPFGATASAYATNDWTVHPTLDPIGLTVRESRDSDEHPASLAIAVIFDVTGSMAGVPRELQTQLPDLLGLLLRKGYATDPQILFGAVGDVYSDHLPLQIGQFESDNTMDRQLEAIILEGNGGGQMSESYGLALYALARHTATDCWDVRGHRGYAFLTGDELPYPTVTRREVATVFGEHIEADIRIETLIAEVRERWNLTFIVPTSTGHGGNPAILTRWRELLGQDAVTVETASAVCDLIALTVGLGEDAIDLATGAADLEEVGSANVASVTKALALVGAGRGRLAVVTGGLPASAGSDDVAFL